jgi:hypothetical protein
MLFISHDRYFINRMATKVVEVKDGGLWDFAGDYDYYMEKRAESQEPRAASREGSAERRAPGGKTRESREPRAERGAPGAKSREPRAASREGSAGREEPRAEDGEPRAASREPRGERRASREVEKPGPVRQPVASADRRPEDAPRAKTKEERRAEAEARQRKSRAIAPLRARLKELEAEIAGIEARVRDLDDRMANPDLYRDSERAREVARERKALEEQAATLYGKWEELALRLESGMADEGS